jgi:serine/threonine protein kinase/Tfp pilus assembly protein PilF
MKCPQCHSAILEDSKFCKECGTQITPAEDAQPSFTKTLETPAEMLTTGSVFADRYQIIDVLGEGGMGEVYRALDKELNEEVALKLIKPEIAADEKAVARFKSELKVARKIVHDNVGRVFELMDDKGVRFISMEYVAGEDLKSFIRRSGRLSIPKAIDIAKQVCGGLRAAHKLGVVHRDLKPSNIMIDRSGNAKIMDFGIARSIETPDITGTGILIGTPQYMSPEQAEGKDIDSRADIYSLGIILYEMVTGHLPFEGESSISVAMQQIRAEPPNPKASNPQIPDDLAALILKCLAKDRSQRYQLAEDVYEHLNNLDQETSLSTSGHPPAELTSAKLSRRFRRVKNGFSPFLIIFLTVLVAFILWQIFPTNTAEELRSIAIFPADDLSPTEDQEWLCQSLAENLIIRLDSVQELFVPSRSAASPMKGKTYKEIGDTLNVAVVLETSIQKNEDNLRISTTLVKVSDSSIIWSEQYNRPYGELISTQDEIALEIVNELKINLLGGDRANLVKHHTESLEANEFYWKGRHFWEMRTEDGMQKGMDFFQQAIDEDPNFALPYVGLADSYLVSGQYGYSNPRLAFQEAKNFVTKAIEIDSGLPEGHVTLAQIEFLSWNWNAAETSFKRSLELNPNYDLAHSWYAAYLAAMERYEEAVTEVKLSIDLSPRSALTNYMLGWIYFANKHYDQAIEQLEATLDMYPDFVIALWVLGRAHLQKGQTIEAIHYLEKANSMGLPWAKANLGHAYGIFGQKEKAIHLLNEMLEDEKKEYIHASGPALIYLGLGNIDKAFEWLERGFRDRDPSMAYGFNIHSMDPILTDPRMMAIIEGMGLK